MPLSRMGRSEPPSKVAAKSLPGEKFGVRLGVHLSRRFYVTAALNRLRAPGLEAAGGCHCEPPDVSAGTQTTHLLPGRPSARGFCREGLATAGWSLGSFTDGVSRGEGVSQVDRQSCPAAAPLTPAPCGIVGCLLGRLVLSFSTLGSGRKEGPQGLRHLPVMLAGWRAARSECPELGDLGHTSRARASADGGLGPPPSCHTGRAPSQE